MLRSLFERGVFVEQKRIDFFSFRVFVVCVLYRVFRAVLYQSLQKFFNVYLACNCPASL